MRSERVKQGNGYVRLRSGFDDCRAWNATNWCSARRDVFRASATSVTAFRHPPFILRSTPSAGNVLKVMTRNSASDVLVFPLFFTPGAGLVAELSELVADARLEAEALLPFAGHLSGYDRMLAARIDQRLKAGGNQKDKKAIFLVAHGQKQDICPSPEMQQLRAILSHHLDHDEIYNVQIDGQPSLANWRNATKVQKCPFVPLMTGMGRIAALIFRLLLISGLMRKSACSHRLARGGSCLRCWPIM